MKNITLSADEKLIEAARKQAASHGTTLNNEFRAWLKQQVAREQPVDKYRRIMEELSYVQTDRKYTREEMNER